MSLVRNPAHYDRAYFDKWYRHPRHRVKSLTYLRRQVSFVLHGAEYLLDAPVRSVLDVGAGEGHWRAELRRLRPALRYHGVDPSEYAVRRYGRRRNIQLGTLGTLRQLRLPRAFDLIVCCGVLNYVPDDEVPAGLRTLHHLARGPVYLEIFSREDDVEGDFETRAAKSARWYRRRLQEAGFVACGLNFYLPGAMAHLASALERAR